MTDDDKKDWRPVPDPTALTTDQLRREIAALRELLEARLDGMDKNTSERLRAVDTLIEERTEAGRRAIDVAFANAKELVNERAEAQQKAIDKADQSTAKQIDTIGIQIASTSKTYDMQIGDLKARVQAIESHKQGGSETWAWIVAGLALLITLASLIFGITSNGDSSLDRVARDLQRRIDQMQLLIQQQRDSPVVVSPTPPAKSEQ